MSNLSVLKSKGQNSISILLVLFCFSLCLSNSKMFWSFFHLWNIIYPCIPWYLILLCFLPTILATFENSEVYISPVLCLVTQSCLIFCDPMDCSLFPQAPLSMRILQERILELVAMPSFRGSSPPRDQAQVSHIAGRFFIMWATRESQRQGRIWTCARIPQWISSPSP